MGFATKRERWIGWALVALGLVARVALAWTTRGANDVGIWEGLRRHMHELGVAGAYGAIPQMNHPPPVLYYDLAAYSVASATGIPFHFAIKVPGLVGEVLAGWILYRRWAPEIGGARALRIVALFAWSLSSILLSGFHGNTDCLYGALVLLAAYLADRRRLGRAGLALAGALNVKLIPVLFVPALAARARSWGELRRYVAGLAMSLLPWLPFFVLAWDGLWRNVVQYASNTDYWGITGLLLGLATVRPIAEGARAAAAIYVAAGKYVVLAAAVLVALLARRRRWSAYASVAAVWAAFLILTPGFGIQYIAGIVPVLFATHPGRAFVYATASGAFALVTYLAWLVPGASPLRSEFVGRLPGASIMFGLLAWAALIEIAAWLVRSAPAPAAERAEVAAEVGSEAPRAGGEAVS